MPGRMGDDFWPGVPRSPVVVRLPDGRLEITELPPHRFECTPGVVVEWVNEVNRLRAALSGLVAALGGDEPDILAAVDAARTALGGG